ncbi:MAG: MucB/RseB C-terminal domain-containing protein [Gammaproteobacteria bacterium]
MPGPSGPSGLFLSMTLSSAVALASPASVHSGATRQRAHDVRAFDVWHLLTGVLLIYHLVPAAQAGELSTARDWLARMSAAVMDLSYSGTFVYRNKERMDSLRIVRRKNEDGVRERLLSLTGLPTEVLRDEHKVICILPKTQATAQPDVVRGAARPRNFQLDALALSGPSLETNYELSMGEHDSRVAGRPTVDIEIRPRDAYRYGYMLSLDRDTAFPLKSRLVNSDGKVLEEIQYTDVDFNSEITDEMLRSEHRGSIAVVSSGEDAITRGGSSDPALGTSPGPSSGRDDLEWSARWLPAGFRLKEHLGDSGTSGEKHHLVYSDGVVSVSVFIEPLGEPGDTLEGPSAMGATHTYGTVRHGVQVISVGRVPARTVAQVANEMEKGTR